MVPDFEGVVMAAMSFTWTLRNAGWADCYVEDSQGRAEARVSYISNAAEDFLSAVTRLVLGATEQRVQFDAEPTASRWIFNQERGQVSIRLLSLPNQFLADEAGTSLWTSRQPIDTLARTVVRAFDQVEEEHGEAGYFEQWRSPFPRQQLEALRSAWRATEHEAHGTAAE
jgi:hypothetical protein